MGAYNYLDHSLSIIDLSNREYSLQIRLKTEGPYFVDPIRGLAYYGDRKMLLASLKYLTIINFQGEVLDRIRLNDSSSSLEGFDFSLGRLDVSRHSGLQYDPDTGEVLLSAIKQQGNGRFQRYVVSLNVPEKRVRLIRLPDFTSRNIGENFGNLNGFNFRRLGDGLVVNPSFSSELVSISMDTTHFFLDSSITSNKAPVFTSDKLKYQSVVDHHTKSVEFYPVFTNADRSYFFRIHKGAFSEEIQREPFYLMVADPDFNKLQEFMFPENYYISPVVSKEGLMFMAFNKHDDQLELLRYRF